MKVDRVVLNALVPHVRDGFAAGYLRLRRLVQHRLRRSRSTFCSTRTRRVERMVSVCESERAD